jgi:aspartate aminotransferase-like enzyme
MTPGPVPVSAAVAAALARPPLYHRDEEFGRLLRRCHDDIATVVGAHRGERVVTWPGTGTMAMESAVANLVGDAATVVVVTGSLGRRFAAIAGQYGSPPVTVVARTGSRVTGAELAGALAGLPRPAVVLAQHCDTSTGVLNDIDELSEAVRGHGAFLVLDAVATAGAMPIAMSGGFIS